MSEFQYVAFQAVDRPLNGRELDFAHRQSSRADVTRWAMSVEYHYSSFRGDVDGFLRGGIFSLHPFHESGELKQVWELQKYLDAVVQIRTRLISGDLRALYLLWLLRGRRRLQRPGRNHRTARVSWYSGVD